MIDAQTMTTSSIQPSRITISSWFNARTVSWAIGIMFAIAIGWHLWLFAQLLQLRSENPNMSAFMQQDISAHPGKQLHQTSVTYGNISNNLKRAVIAAEDSAFTGHSGFDLEGIRVALEKNLASGKITAGGSTISQQLARNLFLSGERSLTRKAEEAIVTVMLEATLSKQRILELYLNYAEWGQGIYGAEAAARHYFGIPAARLTSWESARLAAMLPSPRLYDGHTTRWLSKKTGIVQARMHQVRIP